MPFSIEPSTEIFSRQEFSLLCNARSIDVAVEVGTDLGVFAKEFLSRWNGKMLLCVDPYEQYDHMPYDRETDLFLALQAMAAFHGRVKFIRMASPKAADFVYSFHPIGFVYIDGNHVYDSIKADLAAWWPQIEHPQGILAGHDFDEEHWEVSKAVKEFAQQHDLKIRHTTEGGTPPSWYVYKKEPERLCIFY
jgi:hypothetical protein